MVESLDPETSQHPEQQHNDQTGTTDTEKLDEISDRETEPAKSETEQIVKEVEIASQEDTTKEREPDVNENEEGTKEEQDDSNNEEEIQKEKILKGILKHERTYSNKHVDFNTDVKFIPFDETKDYTIEIQFVKELTKVVKSYRELFQQMKEEKEREEREMLEEDEQDQEADVENKEEEQQSKDKNVVQNNQSEGEMVNKSGNPGFCQEPIGNKEILKDQLLFHEGVPNHTDEEGGKMSESQPGIEDTNNTTDKNHDKLDPQQELIVKESNKQVINEINTCNEEENPATNEINSVGHKITINAKGP